MTTPEVPKTNTEEKTKKILDAKSKVFLRILREMTIQDVKEIRQQLGILIPIRLVVKKAKERRWGYLCKRCNKPAFEFEGLQFAYQVNGKWVHSDSPPLGVPIEDLPWVQDDPQASRAGRNVMDLHCQFCGGEVILNPDRTLVPKRIILLEENRKWWEYQERIKRKKGMV